ncbi:MAG TPA: branched-chain amino acid ABC transporter permease [Gaiellaceae bacterium]|nr:branched-chain amino acid ABC transporter permease [Gaiellaceae bacterium]
MPRFLSPLANVQPTVYLVVAGAVFLLVGSLDSARFASLTVGGVGVGAAYGSLALALVLIYRATHVINFAQGELAMLTTYIAYQLVQWGLSYWEAFFATLAIAFVLGTAIQVTIIRPVQHRSVIGTVIVTVGLFILIDGIASWRWGGIAYAQLPSPFGFGAWEVGGVPIQHLYAGMFGIVLASVLLVWALFRFTKIGLGMRAAALRPAAASLAGVRVDAMLALGWGFAAVLGAVAALMYEPSQFSGLTPTLMQTALVYAFAAAVLGGLESPAGALVGGLAIGVFLNMLAGYAPQVVSLEVPFAFAALLATLLIKPSGLFGQSQVQRV